MKVIFLDVDGVLNTLFTRVRLDNGVVFVEDKFLLFLKEMCDKTGAKIVLTSSWRKGWFDLDKGKSNTNDALDFIALRDKLLEFGIELFDKTPCILDSQRGLEIKQWFEDNNNLCVESFVILDDMAIVRPFNRFFMQISCAEGLREKHVRKVVKMLGEKTSTPMGV